MVMVPAWSSDRALAALLDALDEGALVFDEGARCRAAGHRAAELLGVDPRALVGLERREILAHAAARAITRSALDALADDALAAGSTVVDPIELARAALSGGEPSAVPPRLIVWTSVPIPGDGGVSGRVDVLRDVTRERRAEIAAGELAARLEAEATHDALTGLANRRRFEEESGREHRRSQRAWVSYVIARLDLDGMGRFNEAHGREAGDDLLRRVADELRAPRREYDVVARWDGDAFALLLPGADARAARQILARAQEAVLHRSEALAHPITASAGAAVWTPPSAETPAELLARADEALRAARARGPGSLVIDARHGAWKDDPSADGPASSG